MKRLRFIFSAALMIVAGYEVFPQESGIQFVNAKDVKVDDPFWSPKFQTWSTITVNDVFDKFEGKYDSHGDSSNVFCNFDKVAGGNKGTMNHFGEPWFDGLIYESIRGASDFLAQRPDSRLEARIDGYINRIAAAQSVDSNGYLNTYTILNEPNHRWGENGGFLRWQHDVYNAGMMIDAGIHYYQATGKTELLTLATRFANYMAEYMGPYPKKNIVPAHSGPEEAMIKLYRLYKNDKNLKKKVQVPVHEQDYWNLATYWIENRGNHCGYPLWAAWGNEESEKWIRENKYATPEFGNHSRPSLGVYAQDSIPVFQQKTIEGHAVRATLLATGIAAAAIENRSPEYIKTAKALWDNMTGKKMFITGGVGAVHFDEKFGPDYYLPTDAYLETCAAVGVGFFSQRMNELTGDAKYMDELERSLYNGILTGVSLEGNTYTYQNPLNSDRLSRWKWHPCPCCPPMFLKIMSAVPGYIYAHEANKIYINLFISSEADINLSKLNTVNIKQTTKYPWDGKITLNVNPQKNGAFAVMVRIPGWAQGKENPYGLYTSNIKCEVKLFLNGTLQELNIVNGYAEIDRKWTKGDKIELELPVQPRIITANEKVDLLDGMAAIASGPVIYCLEGIDNENLDSLKLDTSVLLALSYKKDLLNGVNVITGNGIDQKGKEVAITAIPYFAAGNRQSLKPGALTNGYKVWISKTCIGLITGGCIYSQTPVNEKTAFQTSASWKPAIDVRADVAIVYGVGGNPSDRSKKSPFEERVQSWRNKGYTVHFMTGIAWGSYEDYFTGQWDGKQHLDEGQVTVNGDTIWHGRMVPYIVPSLNYIKYMKEKHIKRVIDAGIDAIYLEEPEFWMRGGYSDAFKREWQEYYGFPWRPQDESPENTYLSNKLKYHLYYRALNDVFTYAKEYGKSKGMNIRCYVPTHSLVNYSSWQIVSPEASLASLSCIDGYIAQVWTGTSREPTYYNGVQKERVFENAFLEYGSMESMARPTGRKMFFLTDPIEDRARDWADYKKNYQATFTAQLLYPMINNYEVMPWPERIYEGLYKTCATCDTKEQIPRFYSTQMQVMINTLNDMPLSGNKVSGSHGIGVLMSNSLMFQRFPTHAGYEDPQFSNFYGQTLPLLKRGIPVEIVHIENTGYPDTWKGIKVLVMSYSNMKPLDPEYHKNIAQWVKNGGTLVYCGKDDDPYQSVMEWWNTNGNNYRAPSMHLFKLLGMNLAPSTGEYTCGKGKVYVIREDPKNFVLEANDDKSYFDLIQKAYQTAPNSGKLILKNNLFLERGHYILASVMDESVSSDPLQLSGTFIDLFDPELPVLHEKTIRTGEQACLYDVSKIEDKKTPHVLCGASRIYDETFKQGFYSFIAKSPLNTTNVSRIILPQKPKNITIKDVAGNVITCTENSWDESSHTCLIKFENNPDGVTIVINW